ncbi:MAG: hypothetical protein CL750_04060 [Chloroflexi bacterium]|nr:MAG: DUF1800 domain-containing protein [SAR202 cluster bacterium]MBA14526.1 hypothetical protein [Chloroflexota bacterium]|tara:strand:+ start:3244 stop:4692 length:1449 start_codon:yes stop_codon:yes gene_type:complete
MTTVESKQEISLMAHLLRRAGFGATPAELEKAMSLGYEGMLDELLNPDHPDELPDDLIRRYHVDLSDLRSGGGAHWIYRLVMTDTPLREKVCLFWHRVFATATYKLIQNKPMTSQIDMFREYGMGKFDNLLVQLSKDPAMIMWLDNQDNHGSNINENYGREILELFAMGVGNYSEEDIKETARAFTGWTIENEPYMSIKMRNNTARPYAYMAWQFKYDDSDHDHGQKTILGQTGNWNGEDAVRIICEQESTARFVARHLYHFFVADELPVPQWPHEKPRDPKAIDLMVKAYFESDHNIKAMLKVLFESDFFKDQSSQFARIKSPAEMVVGTLRLAGPIELPSGDIFAADSASSNMGQAILRPPSVEGWQGGTEWINTGAYVERVNFASKILSDPDKEGIRDIISRIQSFSQSKEMNSDSLVEHCIDVLGPLDMLDSTISGLKSYASKFGEMSWESLEESKKFDEATVAIIQLVVSSQEYQMV